MSLRRLILAVVHSLVALARVRVPVAVGRVLGVRLVSALGLCVAGVLVIGVSPSGATTTHLYTGNSFGPGGLGSGAFGDVRSLAVDPSGDVYVFDGVFGNTVGTIYKFNAAGEPVAFSALHSNALSVTAAEINRRSEIA